MKVQAAFRFDKELLDMVKERAAAQKRSLNNYIEHLLYREVGDIPNELTKQAIHEAHHNKNLDAIDDLDEFLDSV